MLKQIQQQQIEKTLSEEEVNWIKLEKYCVNPITGQKGNKVSNKRVKQVWIQLQKLLKEIEQDQSKLIKTKNEWKLQEICDQVEELENALENQMKQRNILEFNA